jgi:hypothetical protein
MFHSGSIATFQKAVFGPDNFWMAFEKFIFLSSHLITVRISPQDNVDVWRSYRMQDILPELIQRFQFDCFLGFANVIDIFIERSFGHNFDPRNESDVAFIDRVAMTDDALLESGKIKPTHMIAALKKEGAALRAYKHLTPEFCVRWP